PHKPIPDSGAMAGPAQADTSTAIVTFAEVRPLFQTYRSRCHPNIMPPDWLQYDEALTYVQNGKLYQRVIEEQTMPLPGTPEAQSMSDEERDLIAKWIQTGAA